MVNDKPDDDSTGYLVAEIETTPVPDESAAPITIFVCHCSHAHYRVFDWSSVGGPDGADPGDDKHVQRVLRSEKREREVDDDQITLADGGRAKCVECGAWLPDEIEPEAGVYCPKCGHGQHIADGGQLLEESVQENDVETEPAEERPTPNPDVVALTVHSVVTESVTPADPTSLPDFDVYCSVIDASHETVSRLVQEASA